jgi:hypothetical protein
MVATVNRAQLKAHGQKHADRGYPRSWLITHQYLLLMSEGYRRVDFRRAARWDVAREQRDCGQH